ncbi:MAG: DJ-1/PfpI family protein [Candidatus Micrarchaeales archaeon]
MKVLIIIPPKDFRDETVSMSKLILGKWGITVAIGSYTKELRQCVGAHGAIYKPDLNATKLTSEGFDGLIIADGPGVETYQLYDFMPLTNLVRDFINSNKIVAAVGNSVKVVARANVITDRKISAPKDEEVSRLIRIYRGKESANEIEFDKNLLTAKSNQNIERIVNTMLEHMGVK